MTTSEKCGLTDQEVTILYRNYRGETAPRRILPQRIWFGETEWHPAGQWLLEALDLDKNAQRSFALSDVLQFNITSTSDVPVG